MGGMYADRRVRRTRPPGHQAHAGSAGELPPCLGHEGRAAFLTAGHDPDVGVVQRVEHGQVALAGDTERRGHAVGHEALDDDLPSGAFGLRLCGHVADPR